jgi:hypothetical protein
LVNLFGTGAAHAAGIPVAVSDMQGGRHTAAPGALRALMAAGWLEFGTHQERVLWASSGNHWSSESPEPRVRLTERGIELAKRRLWEMREKKNG